MKIIRSCFIAFALFLPVPVFGYWYYPTYFYAPPPFWGEARLAKNWLTTIDIRLRGGHATEGFCANDCKVDPLVIYGPQNMHDLAKNVPPQFTGPGTCSYLNTLWKHPAPFCTFGQLGIEGKCSMCEFLPTIVQNLTHGFFVGLCVPIKDSKFSNVIPVDNTNKLMTGTLSLPEWQQFFCYMAENLRTYGICIDSLSRHGVGDVSLFGGWTINNENFEAIDFIDGSVSLGFQFPSGRRSNPFCPFILPTGSDGHYGVSFCATGELGGFDWLTVGLQFGGLKLLSAQRMIAIKTAVEQQGFIKLARTCAQVNPGLQWRVLEFVRLDHLVYGISAVLGFSQTRQNRTYINPTGDVGCDCTIVNSDPQWKAWYMNAFHFVFECDFATFRHPRMPRLGFTIDKAFAGKRVFNTSIFGAQFACDF